MGIKGFQGTSLLDFPGRIATLVFFGFCNLRCPYCHNPALVEAPASLPDLPVSELLEELQQRRRFIDGVVISGGEPTLAPELPQLLRQIKTLGLQVKLDTNGLAPEVISSLLDERLVDFIALDLKTSPDRYPELGSAGGVAPLLEKTLARLHQAGVEVELRTTCVPGLVGSDEIASLGSMVHGMKLWVLQQYQPEPALDPDWARRPPLEARELETLAAVAEAFVERVQIRGLRPVGESLAPRS